MKKRTNPILALVFFFLYSIHVQAGLYNRITIQINGRPVIYLDLVKVDGQKLIIDITALPHKLIALRREASQPQQQEQSWSGWLVQKASSWLFPASQPKPINPGNLVIQQFIRFIRALGCKKLTTYDVLNRSLHRYECMASFGDRTFSVPMLKCHGDRAFTGWDVAFRQGSRDFVLFYLVSNCFLKTMTDNIVFANTGQYPPAETEEKPGDGYGLDYTYYEASSTELVVNIYQRYLPLIVKPDNNEAGFSRDGFSRDGSSGGRDSSVVSNIQAH